MDENGKPIEAKDEATSKETVQPEVDAFGSPVNPEPPPEEKGEKKGKGDDIEKHPLVTELRKQIEDAKNGTHANLTGQRLKIEALERELANVKKGGTGEKKEEGGGEPLFKDIKWSKDLKPEEREEMTDTEIKQMDEIATMKEAQNKFHADMNKKGKEEEGKKVDDLNLLVKATAKELAKDNVEIANQIIESVKQFNLEGLDEKTVKERVANAAKLVPDYKPPKEQPTKGGGAVKEGSGGDDPFGNNKIIEDVQRGNKGTYNL